MNLLAKTFKLQIPNLNQISLALLQVEANFRFAQHCYHMNEKAPKETTEMLVSANFALQKLVEIHPADAAAHNLLGLISEKQGLFNQACLAFQTALSLVQSQGRKDKIPSVLQNYGRSLCSDGSFQEAIAFLLKVTTETPSKQAALGLAYYFNNELKSSMEEFEKVLSSLENQPKARREMVVLICQVNFACMQANLG